MRLRHIKNADKIIESNPLLINKPKELKGDWRSLFKNDNPIFIEIGMGKGKFLVENALRYPDRNFIGIERYSSVMLRALQKIDKYKEQSIIPKNIYFICIDAKELTDVFSLGEIDLIYLNFSDPWPKKRTAERRLTSNTFFKLYSALLLKGHSIEFKTDNKDLFDFSLKTLKDSPFFSLEAVSYDLHNDEKLSKNNIMTEYEEKFSSLENPIYKLIAVRN